MHDIHIVGDKLQLVQITSSSNVYHKDTENLYKLNKKISIVESNYIKLTHQISASGSSQGNWLKFPKHLDRVYKEQKTELRRVKSELKSFLFYEDSSPDQNFSGRAYDSELLIFSKRMALDKTEKVGFGSAISSFQPKNTSEKIHKKQSYLMEIKGKSETYITNAIYDKKEHETLLETAKDIGLIEQSSTKFKAKNNYVSVTYDISQESQVANNEQTKKLNHSLVYNIGQYLRKVEFSEQSDEQELFETIIVLKQK